MVRKNHEYHLNEGEVTLSDAAKWWVEEDKNTGINSDWAYVYRRLGKLEKSRKLISRQYTESGRIKIVKLEDVMELYKKTKESENIQFGEEESIKRICEEKNLKETKKNNKGISDLIDMVMELNTNGGLSHKKASEIIKVLISK